MEIRRLYYAIVEMEISDFSTSITKLSFNLMGEMLAPGDVPYLMSVNAPY